MRVVAVLLLLTAHGFVAHGFVARSQIRTAVRLQAAVAMQQSTDDSSQTMEQKQVGTAPAADGVVVPTQQELDLCNIEGSFCDPADADATSPADDFSYAAFAQNYPFANNVAIATLKTAAADLIAQAVIAQVPLGELDYSRLLLFASFGAIYLGGFQYLYQVNIFKRLFDVDSFTSQPWADKFKDGPGLRALAAQTALDLTVLTLIYLPTFYIFKAGVFSGSADPSVWASSGLESYTTNFAKDEFDLIRVWLPADLICFSVPLYLRLPVRHVVSFVWTAYLSFSRGGH